ncbi:MAG: hypothetical protein SYC29_07435 [Planctomycetota bacterium]|nr:hypothetical protein [Planctomycetota bacterium]
MEPLAWDGAGQAPYNNVIGLDPQLIDPEHGDYRPAPGSPAGEYGCQTFRGRGAAAARDEPAPPRRVAPGPRRDEIEVAGPISQDTTWNADLVRVIGDVIIEDGVTLTIEPATRIEFEDYYRLDVLGTLRALGTPDSRIVFTTDEPEKFVIDDSRLGCWNGIRFIDTSAANESSRLAYGIIEYSKALSGDAGPYPYGGGALSVVDFADLIVENCIIRRCVADYGGAVFCYRDGNPTLADCLIVDNHCLRNASAIYSAYSHPKLINNTIIENIIENEDNPYVESCGVLSFIGKPVFSNNIVRDNDPRVYYLHRQLRHNKAFCTRYNNIEDYAEGVGNIDTDPRFVDPPAGDYRLLVGSPCIDAADNDAVPDNLISDLGGEARFVDDPDTEDTGHGQPPIVDMGAHEYQSSQCPADFDGDGDVDTADLLFLLGAWGSPDGDVDGDGDTDAADLLALLAAWGECARNQR